jgi:protein-disulfide isomerase
MDKRFWGILIAIIVVLGGIYWFTAGNNKANAPSSSSQPTNHIEGQGKDGITLTEYGDYECPYCGEYYPIVKQIASEYSTQIFFQFRNLPLTQIHQNAFAGARAAEAAALQGKFWEMHDALYTNQSSWVNASDPEANFIIYAQQLGLNVTKFKQDFAGAQVNDLINADVSAFAKTGLQEATPTFLLDGKQIQPTASVSSFEQLINAAIKKKGGTPPAAASSTGASTSAGTAGKSVQ